MDGAALHHPNGSLARGPWTLELSVEKAGWSWCSLRVLELAPGESTQVHTGEEEMLVLPLAGSASLLLDQDRVDLAGRDSVFEAVSDFAYLPRSSTVVISSAAGGRFALPGTLARRSFPFRHVRAGEVDVQLRGAGSCSRQVNNLCFPTNCAADRLLVCEVLTPAGNWSSYPPHKHDEEGPGETELEEIYYFEVSSAGGPQADRQGADRQGADRQGAGGRGAATPSRARDGIAYQRVYGTDKRPVDLLAEVRSGDVVLVPHGWHGPSMAVPGYDLYYLNVMGGPGPRQWLVCFDPAHEWVSQTWAGQAVDPRLPIAGVVRPSREGSR